MISNTVRRFSQRGLRVVHQQMPGPLTAIALSIRAGARFDERFPGIAHMSEHMLFQGTRLFDQVALNRRAAELGGEHNADTGYENISLTFEVFNEDVGDALELLAEQFYHSQVDERRFRKERHVVMDEARGRIDDPIERLHQRAWCNFFSGPLAHPVWGSMQSLRQMQAADVAAFIATHFTHGRSVLSLVGGVEFEAAKGAVKRSFSHKSSLEPPKPRKVQYGHAVRPVRVRDDGGQGFILRMMPVTPIPRQIAAAGVALDLVGADPDSRLFQEIRERLGLGYEVGAHLDWGPDWAVVTISASAAHRSLARLEGAITDVCEHAARDGFTPDEIERGRKKLRYRYASLAHSRFDRALALAENTLLGVPPPEEIERIVRSLSKAEVETAWRALMKRPALIARLSA